MFRPWICGDHRGPAGCLRRVLQRHLLCAHRARSPGWPIAGGSRPGRFGRGARTAEFCREPRIRNRFPQSRRPFKVGDTVRLGDFLGNVVDVDSRTVVLQGLDGSWIRIPNSNVANEAIVNLTRDPSAAEPRRW